MRRTVPFIIAGLILGGLACARSTGCKATADCVAPTASVGEEFELAPFGTAAIRGTTFTVRFDSMISDSRCPSDVVCIWGGSAAIHVAVFDAGTEKFQGRLNTGEEPRTIVVDKFELAIVAITPVPRSDSRIAAKDYRARLKLSAKLAAMNHAALPPNP